jgi:hypothetical protein
VSRENEREAELVYRRTLPGGGYVAIEASPVCSPHGARYHGEVVVERRATRRDRSTAPVVACADGPSVDAVLRDLFPIAHSNARIASECIRYSKTQGSDVETGAR